MHSSGSMLKTIIERVRTVLDDGDIDGKYSDAFIVNHIIQPSLADVLSRIGNTANNEIYLYHSVTLSDDVDYYRLPPSIHRVTRLLILDENDNPLSEIIPRTHYAVYGEGWSLEGNPGSMELKITSRSALPSIGSLSLEYIPTGAWANLHYTSAGSGTLATTATASTLYLAATPTLGLLDRRPQSYAGMTLRMLNAAPDQIEEALIESYDKDGTGWFVTTRRPLTHVTSGTGLTYEIAPPGSESLYEAVAMRSAMKLGASRKISQAHMQMIQTEYRSAIKTIADRLTLMQGRVPHHIEKKTIDNRDGYVPFTMSGIGIRT